MKDVTKVYAGEGGKEVLAVESMNLEIRDKEFMVLVGPSGCGKSTVLRMVAGLESITSGDLYVGDRRCNDIPPKDRDIAMVFQNYALYPHMTVAENMAFALKLRRMNSSEIKKRVDEAAEILGLTDYLGRRPKALSGGQRQRVALGRAIVRKPAVFLFDEPLSNLDAKMRGQMRVEISRLAQQLQTTMIYVTHDQTEAVTMGDRIVCMRDGRVQQIGTPLDLYNTPSNRFVAGFIGTPPMNFLECTVDGGTVKIHGSNSEFHLADIDGQRGFDAVKGDVILGVRPEALSINREGTAGIKSTIEVIEPLGPETLVYCKVRDGSQVVARVESDEPVSIGQTVYFTPREKGMHFFTHDDSERPVRAKELETCVH